MYSVGEYSACHILFTVDSDDTACSSGVDHNSATNDVGRLLEAYVDIKRLSRDEY